MRVCGTGDGPHIALDLLFCPFCSDGCCSRVVVDVRLGRCFEQRALGSRGDGEHAEDDDDGWREEAHPVVVLLSRVLVCWCYCCFATLL